MWQVIMIDFSRIIKSKKLVGYAAGASFLGTEFKYKNKIEYLLDDTPNINGKTIDNVPIFAREKLLKEDKSSIFIIVFARTPLAVNSIFNNLEEMGFEYMKNYIDCSYLHFLSISKKLKDNLGIITNFQLFEKVRSKALSSTIKNTVPISGTWLMIELLNNLLPKNEGDVAEFGVYHGGNSKIVLEFSQIPKYLKYHLFDSFKGFPSIVDSDKVHQEDLDSIASDKVHPDNFKDTDYNQVRDTFSNMNNVIIHKGWFQDTIQNIKDCNFTLVHIDCDIYDSTKFCINNLSKSMKKGGFMLFHDYWYPKQKLPEGCWIPYKGVKKAVDEKISRKDILVFPETMHALVKF